MEAKQLNRAKRQTAKIHGGKPSDYEYVEHEVVMLGFVATVNGQTFQATAKSGPRNVWLRRIGTNVNYFIRL